MTDQWDNLFSNTGIDDLFDFDLASLFTDNGAPQPYVGLANLDEDSDSRRLNSWNPGGYGHTCLEGTFTEEDASVEHLNNNTCAKVTENGSDPLPINNSGDNEVDIDFRSPTLPDEPFDQAGLLDHFDINMLEMGQGRNDFSFSGTRLSQTPPRLTTTPWTYPSDLLR